MPGEFIIFFVKKNHPKITLTVMAICLSACQPASPGSGGLYYTEFPKGATHMDLRWPAIRDQTPAVHFRIPKEDMDISRLRGDRPGEVHVVFLHIRIPEQLAKNLYERVPNHGEFKPKPDRKFVRTVELRTALTLGEKGSLFQKTAMLCDRAAT